MFGDSCQVEWVGRFGNKVIPWQRDRLRNVPTWTAYGSDAMVQEAEADG